MSAFLLKIPPFLKAHWKPACAILLIILSFAFGRFSKAENIKTVTKEKTVYVDRVVTKTVEVKAKAEVKNHVVYRDRTVIQYKDGTVERRDVQRVDTGTAKSETSKSESVKSSQQAASSYKAKSLEVSSDRPQWHVGALVGIDPLHIDSGPSYGAHAERRIVGPIWGGLWGLKAGNGFQAGLSLGIEF